MLDLSLEREEREKLLIDRDKFPVQIECSNPFMVPEKVELSSGGVRGIPYWRETSANAEQIEISPQMRELKEKRVELARRRLERIAVSAELLNNVGVAYLNSGNVDESVRYFEEALKKKGDYFSSMANMAKAYFVKGEIDRAMDIYVKIEEKYPKNTRVLNNIANILISKGKLGEAREYLGRVMAVDENDYAALNNMGTISLLERKAQNAISFYRKALQIRSNSSGALNNLGVCYAVSKNYKKAIRHFLEAYYLNKEYIGYVVNLSQAYQQNALHEEAIKILEEYLSRGHDNQKVRSILAWSYASIKNYKNCLKHLKACLQLGVKTGKASDVDWVYNNIAVVYQSLGDFEKAERFYSLSLQYRPLRSPIALYNGISFFFLQNRDERARKLVDLGLLEFPHDANIQAFLGRYYFEVQDYGKSSEIFYHIMEAEPKIATAFSILSVIEIEINRNREKAHEILTKGLSFHPNELSLLNNLAYNYLMSNKPEEARKLLDRIKVRDNVFVSATRGLLLIKEGNVQEGERLYDLAISISSGNEMLVSLVKQKKYLELGRYYMERENRGEALKYLARVLGIRAKYSYYMKEATELLEMVKGG